MKLNLGCGYDLKKGWTNLDSSKIQGVDVVWNIENLPLPFDDETCTDILCQDVLEHTEYIPILKDINRILKKEGEVKIRVPHFTSKNNFVDPTHKKMFSIETFDFFTHSSIHGRNYYFDFSFSSISQRTITFQKGFHIHNYVMEWVINLNTRIMNIYENTFLSRIFPALNIEVTLVK
ncbi:methyltransferase domain-containing protein [Reichenbachiella carrageenanivorans]|uniref:Methyltransferase domain-containing protein n=1 Tax=Reichenbachiella carrageenanivorans TaxID=2979869 RepID=A0ABY6D354_9BACT|nr:methyltransferase domain-containing protein [Reichenbachiella carrageenanivorans]UXX80594.1 methyltransferase domain-containing protein [Reichenbachiella carrageenanivorans]